MNEHILIMVVLTFSVTFAIIFINVNRDIDYVKASDGREYLVVNDSKKQEVANTLARLRNKIDKLVSHMTRRFPDDRNVKLLKERIVDNFDENNIIENAPNGQYTSYSLNKGEKLYFCVRQADNTMVDDNTLMFVALHEMAHLMTENIDNHNDEFWAHMRELISNAIELGLYRYQNYRTSPMEYCGINIKNTPVEG